MKLSDFHIGLEFTCGDRLWRCTDVGSRVVVAIRIDEVEVTSLVGDVQSTRTMTGAEAAADGWFNGPPYAGVERVFDEDDLPACEPAPAGDHSAAEAVGESLPL